MERIRFTDLYKINSCVKEFSDYIWHYTNANGMVGIISSDPNQPKLRFWFTRSDSLNDTSEGTDILKCLELAVKSLKSEGLDDHSFIETVSKFYLTPEISKKQRIVYPIINRNKESEDYGDLGSMLTVEECDAYICSFSTAEDSLDMWRYYADGSGYGLCFHTEKLFWEYSDYPSSNVIDRDLKYIKIDKLPVLYNLDDKLAVVKEALVSAKGAYDQKIDSSTKNDAIESLQDYLDYMLKQNQYRFKHECFSSEKEVRYIAYRPVQKPPLIENELPDIKYRTGYGTIIPYIEIETDAFMPKIKIGPYNRMQNEKPIKDFLIDKGFSYTEVSRSSLPVR